jgi:L-fuconolactonase
MLIWHADNSMASQTDAVESIIEPDLPIIDPHHHLWFIPQATLDNAPEHADEVWRRVITGLRKNSRYLIDEFLADLKTGHNIRATVFIETHTMYRAHGPEYLKSTGEVEFANGVAAMAESGLFGDIKVCAAIVGAADLSLGDAVEEVLEAHIRAGGGRYRGVRNPAHYDADPNLFPTYARPHLLLDPAFRAGFKHLHKFDLSFDVWIWEPQLPELIDLARTFPGTQIILNHVGGPLGSASYAGKREERFHIWWANIQNLAQCPNVAVKLGGLGSTPIQGFKSFMADQPATSAELAVEWKPYIETSIEAFGVERCMFESDYPPGGGSGAYPVLWNAFKRIASGASADEKKALFSGTAAKIYRIDI